MRLARLLIAAVTPLAVTVGITLIPPAQADRPVLVRVLPEATTAPIPVWHPPVWFMEDEPLVAVPPARMMPPEDARCPQWWHLAESVGWPVESLPYLDRVLHGESRCQPDVHYGKDPNGGSYGLTQINGFWCRKNLYNPHPAGWLGARLDGFAGCTDLFDPATNLRAALLVWQYADARGCGWSPWSTASRKWCD